MEQSLGDAVFYLKRTQRMAVKRSDYLETKQSDQLLAREYERTDLPAAHHHRGVGMRIFRQQYDEYRVTIAAKNSAYQGGGGRILSVAIPELRGRGPLYRCGDKLRPSQRGGQVFSPGK